MPQFDIDIFGDEEALQRTLREVDSAILRRREAKADLLPTEEEDWRTMMVFLGAVWRSLAWALHAPKTQRSRSFTILRTYATQLSADIRKLLMTGPSYRLTYALAPYLEDPEASIPPARVAQVLLLQAHAMVEQEHQPPGPPDTHCLRQLSANVIPLLRAALEGTPAATDVDLLAAEIRELIATATQGS